MGDNGMRSGSILSIDLTVPDAEGVRDFYKGLVGWEESPVDMGDYQDFMMLNGGQPVAGICHARGVNQNLPPQWMIYIVVDNLQTAMAKCQELGGSVVIPPRPETGHVMAVLKDPAGAVFTLFQKPE